MRDGWLKGLLVVVLVLGVWLPVSAGGGQYRLVKTIDLPGSKGGHGDWTAFDPDTGTVWLGLAPVSWTLYRWRG